MFTRSLLSALLVLLAVTSAAYSVRVKRYLTAHSITPITNACGKPFIIKCPRMGLIKYWFDKEEYCKRQIYCKDIFLITRGYSHTFTPEAQEFFNHMLILHASDEDLREYGPAVSI